MRTVGIIQARMGSSRLPGKILLPLGDEPVLSWVVTRLGECRNLSEVVVATSDSSDDEAIEKWCDRRKVACFRGSLEDVLDRYYQAATQYSAEAVVRITADCPLIDPDIVDRVIEEFAAGGFDAFSLGGEFPDGLDCQVFAYEALAKAWENAHLKSDREHVGPYIENNRCGSFQIGFMAPFQALADYRWTLDEPRDYEFLSALAYELLTKFTIPSFRTPDILKVLEDFPFLRGINSGIDRNEGYAKSLRGD